MNIKKIFPHIFISFILFLILLGRLQMIFARFIDPDEFAHLHWAYLITAGKLPYRDFFFFITPFYQWFLAPVFLLPQSPALILVARLWQFMVYLASLLLLYKISLHFTRDGWVGLLGVVLMTAFPMTMDKTIDIRPDMLMVCCFLLSVYLTIRKKQSRYDLFWAGIFFSLAILIFPKIIIGAPSFLYLIIHRYRKRLKISFLHLAMGAFIPALFLFGYYAFNNLTSSAIQSILYDSVVANVSKGSFSPLLALSPWPLVYVSAPGPSLPWALNVFLFLSSLPGLCILFLRNKPASIFISLFFLCGIIFLFLFPVPYLQYFLPFTVFISLLASISLSAIIKSAQRYRIALPLIIFIGVITAYSFYLQYQGRSAPTNGEQLHVVSDILKITRPNETVYDMVGSYVFRADGYYICCHLYAEFASRLKMKVPPLSTALTASQTKFLVQDRTGLLFWKPTLEDYTFMISNYLPSRLPKIYSLGRQYSCKNTICIQLDYEGKPLSNAPVTQFQIIAADNYRISSSPAGAMVFIDERVVQNGSIYLTRGKHALNFSSGITHLKIQLDR